MKASIWLLGTGLAIIGLSCSFHPALDTEKYWPCMPGSICPDGCECMDGQVCVPENDELDGAVCQWCPENYADCDDDVATVCEVKLLTDEHNWCGCGVYCHEGMYCQGQRCVSQCSQGMEPCEGWCLNVMTDPENCGYCGNECGSSEVCNQGFCDTNCGDLDNCQGSCVDPNTSTAHCGECGNACGAWDACCEGTCISVKYDEQNCGGCNVICPPEQACDHMVCRECESPEEFCDNDCHDTSTCNSHCGGCGIECADGETCVDSVCVINNCEDPLSPCETGCEDLMNDPENCGSCGNICLTGQKCDSGNCVDVCQQGLTFCSDECVNINNSALHCGGCNSPCDIPPLPVCDDTGQGREVFTAPGTCEAGKCRYPATTQPCQYGCENGICLGEPCEGEICGQFEHCDGVQCVCTATNGPCPAGQDCCDFGCADLNYDNSNCGGCGLSCGDNAHCYLGGCMCLSGHGNCDGDWSTGCEEFLIDNITYCGDCHNDCNVLPPPECSDPNTLVTYFDSVCEGSNCRYFSDSSPCPAGCQDGYCIYDPCLDVVCSPEEDCVDGVCHCNLDPGLVCPNDATCCAGRCVDINTDPLNCGGCHQDCVAGAECTNGQCGKLGVECGADGFCDEITAENVCCATGASDAACVTGNTCETGLIACDGPEDCPGQWDVCCHSPQTPALAECMADESCIWSFGGQVLCNADWQCEWLGVNYGCCPMQVPGMSLHICSEACK